MPRPSVGYACADDGVNIAYTTVGDGQLTIVLVPPLIWQVELAWEEPAFEHFISRLATCAEVVMFDRRGTGLSDHAPASAEGLGLPKLARDVKAVLDENGTEAAVLLGASLGAMTAVQFAHDFPSRTEAMILVGGNARFVRAPGFDLGLAPADVDQWIDDAASLWGTGALLEADAPTMKFDDRYRAWAARLERHTCSPGIIADSLRAAAGYDLRLLLADLRPPALIIHRTGDAAISIEHARYLAAHIPGSSLAELAGEEHTFFLGDHGQMLGAIIDFLDERVADGAMRAAQRRAERKSAYGSGWGSLTPSELEVARLAAAGLTNTEMAERLRMSRFTVDGRLRRVFAKVGVSTRVELSAEYTRIHQ